MANPGDVLGSITKNSDLPKPETAEAVTRRRKVKALIVNDSVQALTTESVEKQGDKELGSSKQVESEIKSLISSGQAIDPPFDMFVLSTMSEYNSEMGPCIDAMKTNIDGFGHRLIYRGEQKELETDKVLARKVREERVRLENFFLYAGLEDSFTKIRKKMRSDLEKTGNAYWEVVRGPKKDIQYFVPVKSYQVRLSNRDKEPTEVDFPIVKIGSDGKSITNETFKAAHHFRRYVQVSSLSNGSKKSWFKQFGDPRVLDRETGQYVPQKNVDSFGDTGKPMPENRKANEIVHWKMNDDRSPYGLPRWIGIFLDILGDRKASEINYITFCNNNIPSLIVSVSNGQLTEETVERVKDFFEKVQGDDNRSKALVLEAEPSDEDEGEDAGAIKIEVKTLTEAQHDDAMFQNYSKENREKVRVIWRLPPIFTGRAEDYTRTTAETSRALADEQVFAPEREDFDDWVNRILFPRMNILYHRFKSNSPNTTDNSELTKILSGAEKTGGITPRIARKVLEDILSIELPPFPDDFNPDIPFSLTMAEAVKNMGNPVEPGQSVTALKGLETVMELTGGSHPLIGALMVLRKSLEDEWLREASGSEENHGE